MNKKNARANSIISAISDKTGLAFDYDITLPEKTAGYYDPENKKIVLNPAHKDPLSYAVVHELTHFVENKKGYSKYVKNIMGSVIYKDMIATKYKGNEDLYYKEIYDTYYDVYKKYDDKTFNSLLEREMVAKFNEYLINEKPEALARLSRNDKGIKAVYRNICEFFEEIKLFLKGESEKAYAMKMARKFRGLAGDKNIETNSEFNADKVYKIEKTSYNEYTKEEYENYGWARANGILNAAQNENYRSKFADLCNKLARFPKTKRGEYIIPVRDSSHPVFKDLENVLVFAKGEIDKPIITRVIEIFEYDETNLDKVRKYIYGLERRGISSESGQVIRQYNASDFKNDYNRRNNKNSGHNNDNGNGRGNSEQITSTEELKQYAITPTAEKNSTEAENKSKDERYQDLIKKYRTIPQGENPYRDVEVPRRSSDKKYISRHARTILEAEVMPDIISLKLIISAFFIILLKNAFKNDIIIQ